MATVKKGALTQAGKWWKHLRWVKRRFWKGERQAGKKLSSKDATESRLVEFGLKAKAEK